MRIARIQVEEGFLGGLDLSLPTGLTVVIGPRGVGKTSLIELVRFCLDAPAMTDKAGERSRQHARSVLGTGEITVTLQSGTQQTIVSRTADESTPRSSAQYAPPIVLSQNEIESLGLDPLGRLRLIDAFRTQLEEERDEAAEMRAAARALTADARAQYNDIDALDEEIKSLDQDVQNLPQLEAENRNTIAQLNSAKAKQTEAELLSQRQAAAGVQLAVLDRAHSSLNAWYGKIVALQGKPPYLEPWPHAAGLPDALATIRTSLGEAEDRLSQAGAIVEKSLRQITVTRADIQSQQLELEARARTFRAELDQLQDGSGQLARRIDELTQKQAKLEAARAYRAQLVDKRNETLSERSAILDSLDDLLDARFQARTRVVSKLNDELHPRIDIQLTRAALATEYAESVRLALRGSGMRYNTLAPQIADRMSPRELVEAAESSNATLVAETLGITTERAARLLSEIASEGADAIVACDVEDIVAIRLLDGSEYKATDKLSMGQRCTVVLPLLLSRPHGILIIDQPEDHLDNAFVVETAVNTICRRQEAAQFLFSTHNPNIPVLGEADLVVHLGSDGKRGFVRHAGPLSATQSVEAISAVMEGGTDAFRRRSEFYGQVGPRE
jgi:prefoldin subunit 5